MNYSIVWTPCSWIYRIVWGLNFPKFRYDQVGQIGFYFAMCRLNPVAPRQLIHRDPPGRFPEPLPTQHLFLPGMGGTNWRCRRWDWWCSGATGPGGGFIGAESTRAHRNSAEACIGGDVCFGGRSAADCSYGSFRFIQVGDAIVRLGPPAKE